MAKSGDISFELTRAQLIQEAMEHLGVLGEGVVPNTAQYASMGVTLNSMIKAWQTRGTHLFVNQRLYLFLQKDDREYNVNFTASSSDELTAAFYATSVDGEVATSATAVTVDDGTNVTNGDRIGILDANNSMHWTTVASGGGTTSLVLTTANTTTTLPDGAIVYTYTTKASRPRKILEASWREAPTADFGFHDSLDGAEIDIDVLARADYASLSLKSASGRVNQIYYDKTHPNAIIRVWPEPDIGGRYLTLWCERTLEDVDGDSDAFDFPPEWYLALAMNLAKWSATKYGVADKTWNRIRGLAAESLFDVESADREEYMKFEPDLERR